MNFVSLYCNKVKFMLISSLDLIFLSENDFSFEGVERHGEIYGTVMGRSFYESH